MTVLVAPPPGSAPAKTLRQRHPPAKSLPAHAGQKHRLDLRLDPRRQHRHGLLTGADVISQGTDPTEVRGIVGLNYLLPLNIESTAWLDTDGGARFLLAKDFDLTPRLGLHGKVEYDTHEEWQEDVVFSYIVAKNFSILAGYHSDYGFGAGIEIRF